MLGASKTYLAGLEVITLGDLGSVGSAYLLGSLLIATARLGLLLLLHLEQAVRIVD